ncbi:MAG TPA: hypothetical protein VGL59_19030 [Polyangia bacterium]|jgi:hypothetical protein
MKRFLIQYTFHPDSGLVEDWHRQVAAFIASLDSDPVLRGRIAYHCMKAIEGQNYYHLAEPRDDEAAKLLSQRDYFKRYTDDIKRVGGGVVSVIPLETIAETSAG